MSQSSDQLRKEHAMTQTAHTPTRLQKLLEKALEEISIGDPEKAETYIELALAEETAAPSKPLFALGQIVSTPGAIEALTQEGGDFLEYLTRHVSGDWGDLCDDDKRENELSVKDGLRILSTYRLPRTGAKLWIITEADRSATTFLLPEEY
jgi:hypothetical protein